MIEKKRVVAKKVRISDLVSGRYIPGSKDEMKASYVITALGVKISRVNVIGTIVEKFSNEDGSYSSLTIDDSTGTIRIKAFGEDARKIGIFEIGDSVLAIGKVKQYNGETYVNSEIVKEINDANAESMRRLEILKELIEKKRVVDEIRQLSAQNSQEELRDIVKDKFSLDSDSLQFILDNFKVEKQIDYVPKMLELIQTLDDGNGVEIGKILEITDLPENLIESAINQLLANGSLFEPRPGVLKKV